MTDTHPTERETNVLAGASVLVIGALLCLLMAMCSGCVAPAHVVLTADNVYWFHLDNYEATCGKAAAPDCRPRYESLVAFRHRIEEARAAVVRGGDLPLQLDAMKAAQKAVK